MQGLVTGFLLCGSMQTASISPAFWHAARRQMCDVDRCSGFDREWQHSYLLGDSFTILDGRLSQVKADPWPEGYGMFLHQSAQTTPGRSVMVLACHHSLPIFSNNNRSSIQFTFIPVSELFHVSLSQCCESNWLVRSPGSDTVGCCLLLLITIDFLYTSLKNQ